MVLGIKEGLVECATVCVKSVVILTNMFKIEQAHGNIQGHGESTLPFLGRYIKSIPIRGRGQIKPTPNYYAMVSLELPALLL